MKTVADTMVLRYFLAVDRSDLLFSVVGVPVLVPTLVFDPTDKEESEQSQSELRRGIAYQQRRSADLTLEAEIRAEAMVVEQRLSVLDQMCVDGVVVASDMTGAERKIYSDLVEDAGAKKLGLAFGLHPGEAACIAMAIKRDLVLATDDNDALQAYAALKPDGKQTRIRRILQEASEHGRITQREANAIHAEIVGSGFWGRESPFPSPVQPNEPSPSLPPMDPSQADLRPHPQ